MNKRVLIIFVAVLLIAVVALAVFLLASSGGEGSATEVDFVIPDPFYINVYDNYSILKAGIVLVLDTNDSGRVALLESKMPQIRDTLIDALRAISINMLSDPGRYGEIKDILTASLNETLKDSGGEPLNIVKGIYFTDYYIQ